MTAQPEQQQWRKVYWPNEEYPWGVIEGPETAQYRDQSFGPFTDERIVAHCYHEADADAIIADHATAQVASTLLAALREARTDFVVSQHIADEDYDEWSDQTQDVYNHAVNAIKRIDVAIALAEASQLPPEGTA